MKQYGLVIISLLALVSCERAGGDFYPSGKPEYGEDPQSPMELDFSSVGWHSGSLAFPDYSANVVYLDPVGNAESAENDEVIDRTADINRAIATIATPGTVILRAGRYYVGEGGAQIRVLRNNVIVRGETDDSKSDPRERNLATIIGTWQNPSCSTTKPRLMVLGPNPKDYIQGTSSKIIGSHVPEGSMWVCVALPKLFNVGDNVAIYRPDNSLWSHDLGMDYILGTKEHASEVYTWNDYGYVFDIRAERKIVAIQGNKIFLDAPVPMALDEKYGGGILQHYRYPVNRISESGVEYLNFDTFFDETILSTKNGNSRDFDEPYYADENHFWDAVRVSMAENCWVRGITATHFAFATVSLYNHSKFITVHDCHSYDPVSIVYSPRRYAFAIADAQLCLVRDCTCRKDRHQFVTTGVGAVGPNVFYNCQAFEAYNNAGPHSHWATMTLYDNVITDNLLSVEDVQNSGFATGAQGWQGANQVFWNCDAASITCQNPQVSARNWCWGCTGVKSYGNLDRTCNEGDRPDGKWCSHGIHMPVASLYLYQLVNR